MGTYLLDHWHLRFRIKATESQATDEEIEDQFDLQLEQLIEHCKDELSLIPQMAGEPPTGCASLLAPDSRSLSLLQSRSPYRAPANILLPNFKPECFERCCRMEAMGSATRL